MNLRRFIATSLMIIMLVSTGTLVNASTFPDVTSKHAWATQYIDDMVTRGILKGYPDGSFKPDKSISKMESLILAARILGFTTADNAKYIEAAANAFKSDLELYDIPYKNEVAYLLYWNVLNLSDLPTYIADSVKNVPLKRHEAAVLLTKVMGAETQALSNTMVILDYTDESSIPTTSKAYVDFVNKQGIMKGIDNNEFAPQGEVTRAMMATMMFRVEQAMDINIVTANVVSASAINSTITATNTNDEHMEITVTAETIIIIDGLESSLVALTPGVNIRVHYQGENIRLIEAIMTDLQFSTTGFIKAIATNNGAKIITVVDTAGSNDVSKQYLISANCDFKLDGAFATFNSLNSGMYVKLQIKSGKVESVEAEMKEKTYNGIVQSIEITPEPILTVKLTDGSIINYGFASNSTILRNGLNVDASMISSNDVVQMTVQYGVIKRITATSKDRSTEGTIEEIIISSNPRITIKEGGTSKTYNVTSTTQFVLDGKTGNQIYDLRVGASVKLQLESDNINKIETSALVVSPVLIGVVNYVYPTGNVMGIDVKDPVTGVVTTIQTVVKVTAKITDTTASRITQFKQIEKGRSVVLVGIVNYGVFEVSSITITQ